MGKEQNLDEAVSVSESDQASEGQKESLGKSMTRYEFDIEMVRRERRLVPALASPSEARGFTKRIHRGTHLDSLFAGWSRRRRWSGRNSYLGSDHRSVVRLRDQTIGRGFIANYARWRMDRALERIFRSRYVQRYVRTAGLPQGNRIKIVS